MYYLIHPQADQLLKNMPPDDMVIYDDVLRCLLQWEDYKESKYQNDIEHIDDYVIYDVDRAAKISWTDREYVIETLEEFDDIDILAIDVDGKNKIYIRGKEV